MIMTTTTITAAEAANSALAAASEVGDDVDEVSASGPTRRWAADHAADAAMYALPHYCYCSSGRCTGTR